MRGWQFAESCASPACLETAIAKAGAARENYSASLRQATNGKLKGATWLALASSYQLEAELVTLEHPDAAAQLRQQAHGAGLEMLSSDPAF